MLNAVGFAAQYARIVCAPEEPETTRGTPSYPDSASIPLAELAYMQGFPPPADKQITRANYLVEYPKLRWAFQHMRELIPSRQIARGAVQTTELPSGPDRQADIDALSIELVDGSRIGFSEFLDRSYADALLIVHKGKVIYETYPNLHDSQSPHMLWSVTKSFTGMIAHMLVLEGQLDPQSQVTEHIPELAGSGWAGASVQQVLDMTADVKYSEVYADGTSDVIHYGLAAGITQSPQWTGPASLYQYLPSIGADRPHGEHFAYRTVHSEVLGWIIRRVSGKDLAQQISERIWCKLGAEQDAYILLDGNGTEWAGAGLNATLRDLGRFAEMLRLDGRYNGQQVVPAELIREIQRGGDKAAFERFGRKGMEGYSYHNQWWVSHNTDAVFEAMGVHGQLVHVNPGAELCLVRLGSHPVASNDFTYEMTRRVTEALAQLLRG
ncbi:MAG: serine hydrolase [Halopseudomonas sp.]|uniref:serine hydrolase domain-containing protein n=1 Tax=Halopseudomonas sp. TaxID=2901191 RepID=UPI003002A424